jgi:ABC-type transport system substrate-binding protein
MTASRFRRPRRYSRRRFLALSAGVAGAVLVGCGDSDEANPRSITATPTGEPLPSIRLRSRARLPQQVADAVRIGVVPVEGAGDFSPLEQDLVYSRLVGFDPRQSVAYVDLAREVEFIEPLLLRVSLEPEALFHAGDDGVSHRVTAERVLRDFRRKAADEVYLFSEVIEHLEAPDDETLLIGLRAPFALLFELLARPEASIRGPGRYAAFDEPVGSGPFIPVGRLGWGQAFAASPGWYGGVPAIAELGTVYAQQDRELDTFFVRGDTDVRAHPDADSRTAATARRDVMRVTRPSRGMRGLGLSLLGQKDSRPVRYVEAFQDERVRRAVSRALDREALNELDGAMLSGPVGPAHAGDALPVSELAAHELLTHDPADARALLQAAEAEHLAFRIQHQDSSGMLVLGRLIVEQLHEAGFDPALNAMPQAEWESAFLHGDFEATIFELKPLETPDLGLRLHTSGGLSGRYSLWGYSDPVYDAAVREVLSELDPEARARRSRHAQRLLLEQVPAMFPIGAPRDHASIAATLHGYEFGAYGFNSGYLAATWTRTPAVPTDDDADDGQDEEDG